MLEELDLHQGVIAGLDLDVLKGGLRLPDQGAGNGDIAGRSKALNTAQQIVLDAIALLTGDDDRADLGGQGHHKGLFLFAKELLNLALDDQDTQGRTLI